ncbi:MAG: arginine N-succinyltransferase [Bradymonadia bacterium]
MLIVRASRTSDLDALYEMAEAAAIGLTTLPRDHDMLRAYLEDSKHAFEKKVSKPRDERYLLVMEDALSGEIVGCAGITGRVGGFEPHYTYDLSSETIASESLAVSKVIETLHLSETHKGPSEIGTLFVRPERRRHGGGRLMSLSRFLFMAVHPIRFAPLVIAEMRGRSNEEGQSPFWENIGRHFFDLNFAQADLLSASDKQFIADLMPRHPIYIPMLSPEAQGVIGQVHSETEPALKLLRQEGFTFADAVDIFDAGPVLSVEREDIRSIKESERGKFSEVLKTTSSSADFIIANPSIEFRAGLGSVQRLDNGAVALEQSLALGLNLKLGDEVIFTPVRATK